MPDLINYMKYNAKTILGILQREGVNIDSLSEKGMGDLENFIIQLYNNAFEEGRSSVDFSDLDLEIDRD